jgi:hypothetical protein
MTAVARQSESLSGSVGLLNISTVASRNRAYYLEHRERILEAKRNRAVTKRDQILAYHKHYYRNNIDKIRAHASTNADKIKERKVCALLVFVLFLIPRLCTTPHTRSNSKTDRTKERKNCRSTISFINKKPKQSGYGGFKKTQLCYWFFPNVFPTLNLTRNLNPSLKLLHPQTGIGFAGKIFETTRTYVVS